MSLPTLLKKGSLKFDTTKKQKEFDDIIPINYILDHVAEQIKADEKMLLLISKTGSGKSTLLPTEIYKRFFNIYNKNIAITQPRILTAIEIPTSIVKEKWATGFKLEENIGYQTGVFMKKPYKGIVYMTIGVLAQQFKHQTDEWIMDYYSFIIIDECHVKPIELDLLFYLIKEFLRRNENNKKCPFFICMSATFRYEVYQKYFNVKKDNIITVEGFGYNIADKFLDFNTNDYNLSIITEIEKINKENSADLPQQSDILVFLAGKQEILNAKNILMESLTNSKNYLILSITAEAIKEHNYDYMQINRPINEIENGIYKRKIILATNVAETGLTIDYLKYVVDTGYTKSIYFNSNYSLKGLITRPAFKNMTIQRRGRVGRKFNGEYHALFSKESFGELQENEFPEIYNANLSNFILYFYAIGNEPDDSGVKKEKVNMNELQFIDPLPIDLLNHANNYLFNMGLINTTGEITNIGLIIDNMFLVYLEDYKIAIMKMILSGFAWNVSILDLITIASFIQINQKSYIPEDLTLQSNIFKVNFPILKNNTTTKNILYKIKTIICDDFIESLFIFNGFIQNINNAEQWCLDNKLNYKDFLYVLKIRDDIINQLILNKINPFHNNEKSILYFDESNEKDFIEYLVNLKQCIYEGFKTNLCIWNESENVYKYAYFNNLTVKTPRSFNTKSFKLLKDLFIEPTKNPKYIISADFMLRPKYPNSDIYKINTTKCSVLDGYINPDLTFFYK